MFIQDNLARIMSIRNQRHLPSWLRFIHSLEANLSACPGLSSLVRFYCGRCHVYRFESRSKIDECFNRVRSDDGACDQAGGAGLQVLQL